MRALIKSKLSKILGVQKFPHSGFEKQIYPKTGFFNTLSINYMDLNNKKYHDIE